MKTFLAGLAIAGAVFGVIVSSAVAQQAKPTIVLVHGAFADSSSWNGVIKILEKDGYPVVGAANPLRSVKGDAQYVSNILAGIKSPVVLVGHSYGGSVITTRLTAMRTSKRWSTSLHLRPIRENPRSDLLASFPEARSVTN